ncbi:MAG: cobalamin-dependent protein [Candidatus Bathyarchaeia archaeon]
MKDEVLNRLMNAVLTYDPEAAFNTAKETLQKGIDPIEAIEEGLAKGVRIAGELVMAAEAMKQVLKVFEPAILKSAKKKKTLGKVLIGTVEGDIHDIGKNIVSTLLMVTGFEVIDIGVDVSAEKFIEKVKEVEPGVVGMSALMITTMIKMASVIEALKCEGLREKVKIIIGRAPTSKKWADEIGAAGHGADAMETVKIAKKLVGVLNN